MTLLQCSAMKVVSSRWWCALFALSLSAPSLGQGLVRDREAPTIGHEELRTGLVGEPLRIVAELRDPAGVFEPTVLYRLVGEQEFLRLPMVRTSERHTYEAIIDGAVVTGEVEYFIEVFDRFGNGPARYGDAELPVRVRVQRIATVGPDAPAVDEALATDGDSSRENANTEEEPGSVLPWALLGVGVAALAVGAGVAAVVLLSPAPTPSTVMVSVTAPGPLPTSVSP